MTSIVGKDFPTHPISTKVSECPSCIFLVSVIVTVVMAVASLLYSPTIVAGVSNFAPDESESKLDEIQVTSLKEQWANSLRISRQINGTSGYVQQTQIAGSIYVIFYVREDQPATNLLSEDALSFIKSINQQILDIPSYLSDGCWKPTEAYTSCVPLNSVLQYFYPGEVVPRSTSSSYSFSGVTGSNAFESALELMFNNNAYGWYLDRKANVDTKFATAIRQGIQFGTPVLTSAGLVDMPSRDAEGYARSVRAIADNIDHPYMAAVVGGYKVFDSLVSDALKGDAPWIFVSCIFVLVAFRIHMHSFMLAFFGCVQMLCLFPMSLLLFGISKDEVSLLLSLSYYVSMLINCCAQMITFDAFKHSGIIPTSGSKNNLTIAQRTAYVFRRAGSGVAATSTCGFVCFLVAVVLSRIEAIRQFSSMMLIMIAVNLVLQLTYTPSMILVHHFYLSHRRRNQQKQRELLEAASSRSRPKAQVRFQEDINAIFASNGHPTYVTMLKNMEESQKDELSERNDDKGLAWKLNLKQYISKVSTKVKEVSAPSPTESDPSGFEDVDENGVVRDDTAHIFSQSTLKAVRIQNANSENIHTVEGELLAQSVADMGVIEVAPKEVLRDFQTRSGVAPAKGSPDSKEATFVAKLLAHHLESHGWAVNVPAPKAAQAMVKARPPSKEKYTWYTRLYQNIVLRSVQSRKYVIFGKRVGESSEERRQRIMELPAKEEGFNRMERGLMNYFAPGLNKARYPVLALMIAILIIGLVCAALIKVDSDVPSFLEAGNALDKYSAKEVLFAESESCDFCSPYFTYSYAVNTTEVGICASQLGYTSLTAEVNICNSCKGNIDCLPCSSVAGFEVDSCSQCIIEGDARKNSCETCTSIESGMWQATGCGPCALAGLSNGGPNCSVSCGTCGIGTVCDTLLGTCKCATCYTSSSSCNNRGSIYTAADIHSSLVGKCICHKQSFGPSCESCRCYNGGTCQADGSCNCVGDWTGPQCTQCSATCRRNGRCPLQYNHSHYSYFQCRDLFCTPAEVQNYTTETYSCSLCDINRVTSGCSSSTKTCTVDTYNTTTPGTTCHTCRNYFSGADCGGCSAPSGLSCDVNGEPIGCDGGRAISGQFKTLDSCGICGGNNDCVGCNPSVPGLSYDLCGVCGGSNDCLKATPSSIQILWNVDPNNVLQSLQEIYANCTAVRVSSLVLSNPTACSLGTFLDEYTGDGGTDNVSRSLFAHARDGGYLESMLFNQPVLGTTLPLVAEHFIATFRSSTLTDNSPDGDILKMENNLKSIVEGSSFVAWSSAWVAADVRQAIGMDTAVVLTVAFVATVAVIGTYSVSFRIIVAACFVLAVTLMWSLGMIRMLGRTLGPIEMIVVLFAYAMEVSCLMYMTEGYVEQLHFTQSHLLAEYTTRKKNVKGMLRRTGVPVLFSTGLVFVASLLLLGPKLVIFNVIGTFMSILSLCTAFFAVVGFTAVLLIMGPAKSHRRPLFMIVAAVVSVAVTSIAAVVALVATDRL